jgi:hypothetical protein
MISRRLVAYSSMICRISSERVGLVAGACLPGLVFRVEASCRISRQEPKGPIDLHQRDRPPTEAALRAPRAPTSAPMICPPQINSRDLVPMAADYSATGPDSQSTRARKVIAPDRFFLVKPAPATVGKMLQSLEPRGMARRRLPLPADAPKAPWPGENLPTGWRPQRYALGPFWGLAGSWNGPALQPHRSRDRGARDMERERARLLIRNQQREQQRSRSPRAAGLCSFLAPHQSQPDCRQGRRITL